MILTRRLGRTGEAVEIAFRGLIKRESIYERAKSAVKYLFSFARGNASKIAKMRVKKCARELSDWRDFDGVPQANDVAWRREKRMGCSMLHKCQIFFAASLFKKGDKYN